MEGIFRLAGSEKRIKELREAFNSPDRYGKGLDWTGYTVHDAANILRRYFNQLPEPIIPLQYYERFRDPLRPHVSSSVGPDGGLQFETNFDVEGVIRVYQKLITEIPPLNRQLLLYILDLLAVFAAKSDQNKMTTQNLSAIFQPGILNHPQHDMAPNEYRLSQAVLVFLIENQDHFLVGMRGTAADPQTIHEMQSGASGQKGTGTPTRSKTTSLGRSSSNASAGAESVRRYGGVRRNVSVSSRNSRGSTVAPSPVTPSFATAGGVHRSNTLPSKKSPAVPSGRFGQDRPSNPSTPATPPGGAAAQTKEVLAAPAPAPSAVPPQEIAPLAAPEIISPSSEDTTPVASEVNPVNDVVATAPETPKPTTPGHHLSPPEGNVVSPGTQEPSEAQPKTRSLSSMFVRSSSQEPDGRKPNKLQKKRLPGSANPSAQSSTTSLTGRDVELPPSPMPKENPMEQIAESSATPGNQLNISAKDHANNELAAPLDSTPQKGSSLKPSMSPSTSFRSHSTVTDLSELEHGEETPTAAEGGAEKEKKRRWRFSSNHRKDTDKTIVSGDSTLGVNAGAQQSASSVSSAGGGHHHRGRKSFNAERGAAFSPEPPATRGSQPLAPDNGTPSKEADRKREGPIDWFKGKLAERKAEKERAKSPPAQGSTGSGNGSRSSLHLGRPKEEQAGSRGKSMDIPRPTETSETEPQKEATSAQE